MNLLEYIPLHYIYLLKLTGGTLGTLSTFSDLHTISTGGFTINLVASHNESDWMIIHQVT